MINKTNLVLNSYVTLLASGNASGSVPCVGRFVLAGMVWTQNEAVTLEISEGINDYTGVELYRDVTTFAVAAGAALRVIRDICGKYIRVRVINTSGLNPTTIEVYFETRLR